MSNWKKLRLILALIILVASVLLLIWGLMPLLYESRVVPIPPGDLQLPSPGAFLLGNWLL
jgi:hypothetical protein